MKRILLVFFVIVFASLFTGCFRIEVISEPSGDPNPDEIIEVKDNLEIALSKIKEVLKDDEWVKNNLYMTHDCFGEETSGDQQITYNYFGKDKIIAQAFSYDYGAFGITTTVIYYDNGEIKTCSFPGLDTPNHPGHGGFSIDSEKEVLVSYYIHMGYYMTTYYKFNKDHFEKIAEFNSVEDISNYTESGDYRVDYEIRIGDSFESGNVYSVEYENKEKEYSKDYNYEPIDLTVDEL